MGQDLSDAELTALQERLQDFDEFKKTVFIRDEMQRMGGLAFAIGVVAAILNAIVLAGQVDGGISAIFQNWFLATGTRSVITVLLRFLAGASLAGLLIGAGLLLYAPIHKTHTYKKVHKNFVDNGWIARGKPVNVKMEDDGIWIKKPVPVVLWSRELPKNQSGWDRDLTLLNKDLQSSDQAMMLTLLLNDRKFHGAISVRDLRSQYEKPRSGGGQSLIGFGPLNNVPARDDLAVVAPNSKETTSSPKPWDKLVFWILRK
ncbi:MAG: hypothetical protein QM234_10120 [Acidobacteriota bacterium]|nr:hypothetical protein [Acidobacteriota bacterium]